MSQTKEKRNGLFSFWTGWTPNPCICRDTHTHTHTHTLAPVPCIRVTPLTQTHIHPHHPLWHATVPGLPYKSHGESRKLRLSRTCTVHSSSSRVETQQTKRRPGVFLPLALHQLLPKVLQFLIKWPLLTAINDRHSSPLGLWGVYICAEGKKVLELTATAQD